MAIRAAVEDLWEASFVVEVRDIGRASRGVSE